MAGIAHVAELEWDAAFELSRSVGTEWSCYGGAMRIYFFWDEKTSHVVIGSLPGHLRSSLS